MPNSNSIIFNTLAAARGNIQTVHLNRPQALNALTPEIIRGLHQKLDQWQNDDNTKLVIITGEGERAFCAGGDLRLIHEAKHGTRSLDDEFFYHEYDMNRALFHFDKPYLSILDGYTMGGGAGISIHGSIRVATENLKFAMPETGIGFFPDIGAGHFLSRLPHRFGWYLGLTGQTINAADTYACGLATHLIESSAIEKLLQQLKTQPLDDADDISGIIQSFTQPTLESEYWQHHDIIERCFDANSVEEIIAKLSQKSSSFCQQTVTTLQTRAPLSLKITLEHLNRSVGRSFDATMDEESILAKNFLQGRDFYEGIRAMIIDKDRKPKWNPATLEAVSDELVQSYFK